MEISLEMSHYNQKICRVLSLLLIVSVAGNMLTGIAYAGSTDSEKIRVSSETLVVDNEARYAEFIGNVRATQGNTVITADSLKIFYKARSGKKSAGTEESIEKIEAEGHVKIKFDNRVAETEQAVYTTESRILVLSGSASKITSRKDSVTGSKIIFYRDEERIKVEGSSQKPVEAIFYPGGKGIN